MLTDLSPMLITVLAFARGCDRGVRDRPVRRRSDAGAASALRAQRSDVEQPAALAASFDALVSSYFDEKRFGVEGSVRAKLRRELVRAGFFRADAINYYIFARLAVVVVLPTAAYLLADNFLGRSANGISSSVWWLWLCSSQCWDLMPTSRRRTENCNDGFRIAFPDMLDLMVVCVDAGLSLEAALDRISGEIMRQNRHLGINLHLLGAETRAGRSTIDALDALPTGWDWTRRAPLPGLLRQSIELGTDVGDALRVFSDEMRDRRLLRAEERANQLPVKMVGPLGLFIFPVILMVAMVPVAIRLLSVMK